jgi:hypothetical protein
VVAGVVQVESREERVARNESTARQINEQIEQGHPDAPSEEHIRVLCECGRLECDRVLAITIAKYESVRADARQFAVAHGHVMPELEHAVAHGARSLGRSTRDSGLPGRSEGETAAVRCGWGARDASPPSAGR